MKLYLEIVIFKKAHEVGRKSRRGLEEELEGREWKEI